MVLKPVDMPAPLYPFPEVVDNTMISAFRRCEQYWYYQSVRKIIKQEGSTHLIAGAAFARGLEVTRKSFFQENLTFRQSLDQGVAALIIEYGLHEPIDKLKSKSVWNMVAALDFYFKAFQIDKVLTPFKLANDKYAIEFSFAEPTNVLHPVTGSPILYAGRFDMIGQHDTGLLYVTDEKTTAQLGDYWMARWLMSNQMTGYVWAARRMGIPVKGAWIRGIAIRAKNLESANVPTLRPQWRIDTWERNLTLTLHKMINAWKFSQYQLNYDTACSAYGGCSYMDLCQVSDPEQWIPINYFPNTWSPLHSRD